jgi:diadenosine tetraphosphate (Ap4A) HIT family hydrolase
VPILQSAARARFFETATTLAILDAYPVTEGHALIIPRRHVASIFDLPSEELVALWTQVLAVRRLFVKKFTPFSVSVRRLKNSLPHQLIFQVKPET